MSGLFGIADAGGNEGVASSVEAMAACMRHRPWHVTETYVDPRVSVGLGRIGIGLFNSDPQPFRSDDEATLVFFCGVLFDPPRQHSNEAVLIDQLYREHGATFAKHLKGEFIVLIWDRRRQEVILTNDRFGFYPTYYACVGRRLVFAPEVKAILGPGRFPRRLDMTALAEYMRFQNLIGERTFFEGVSQLPYASALRFSLARGEISLESYWHLAEIAERDVKFADAVEETGRLLKRAVNRYPASGSRTALYLTGGLDSRLLLGLVDAQHQPLTTLTFGQRHSRDRIYARRLAWLAGSHHQEFSLDDGRWVTDNVDLHLDLTEGFHSWIHAHGISTLPAARSLADVVLTGCGGGSVVGGWLNRLPPIAVDSDDLNVLATDQFHRFNQLYTWPGLSEADEYALYAEPLSGEMRGRAFASLRVEVGRFMRCRPAFRADALYVRNHDFRMIHNLIVMMRSHVEACSPYFDLDLFEFVYSLPQAIRGYKRLLRAVLQQRAPRLTYVPHARDGFLPTTHNYLRNPHAWLVRLRRKLNAHIAPIFSEPYPLYADYEAYVRRDLRAWAEDLLTGSRICERGLFNPAFLRSLWRRLESGAEPDIVGKAAPIMSYELMLRRFCDGS